MDYKLATALIWYLEIFFQIIGLTNENLQARFASTLFVKSAVVWMRNRNNDLSMLKWSNLK